MSRRRTLLVMRLLPLAGTVLAVALALTGCGSAAPGAPQPTASTAVASTERAVSPSASKATGTPVVAKLVNGFWRVRDAAGEPADSWLRFSPIAVTLFRPGGRIDGALAAQGDHLLADQESWSMSLGDDHEARWLTAADRVQRDGDGWALLDTHGRTVARLVRDGRPAPSKQYETEPSAFVGATVRLRSATPGAGVVDLPTTALVGTWSLAGRSDASLTFGSDGRYEAATSCASGTGANGGAGRYRVLPGGLLLATQYASTAIGCAGPSEPPSPDAAAIGDVTQARSFRIDGDRLTLFDVEGTRIGSLSR